MSRSVVDDAAPARVMLLNRDLLLDGGVARALLSVARHHDRSRLRLSIACFQAPSGDDRAPFEAEDLEVVALGDDYLRAGWRLRRALVASGAEVVVANSFKTYAIAKAVAVGLPCRVAYWLHSARLDVRGPVRRATFRALSRDDTLVCVSQAVALAHQLTDHPHAVVLDHGVDEAPTPSASAAERRELRSRLGIAADDVVVANVASFIPLKDHATLLQAFARAARSDDRLRLVLIGVGPLVNEMRTLAEALGCSDRVAFLGVRRDVRRLLELADVYAQPSRGEGFGLAVIEAMLAGVPVITSDEGAFPEYVVHGRTGLVHAAGDADALSAAILDLTRDTSRAAAIAAAGRDLARERFSIERFAHRFTDLVTREAAIVRRAKAARREAAAQPPRHGERA